MRRKVISVDKPLITAQEGHCEDLSDQTCLTWGIADVAKMMGCSETTIYSAIREKRFPCLRLGKTLRIPKIALQRILESGDLNPVVTENRIVITEQMAREVAKTLAKELLTLEQQRLADQLRTIGGNVRL